MRNAPLPQPGDVLLGKYRIERVLGRGGGGVVMEASHLVLDRRVAIKLMQPDRMTGEGIARLLREARITASLDSDRIVRVIDVGQTEHRVPYIEMELLDGRDLGAELAARGPFPVAEAVDLVLEACAGIAAAHAVGLVHRDLKPANLFLASRPNRRPKLKILDFGFSKISPGRTRAEFRTLTASAAVFGTAQYMSPEQLESTKHVDARSDQHALGVILWELLAGASPFARPTTLQVAVAIANEPAASVRKKRPDVPPELDAAILRALAKNRDERFPDVRAFATAIAPFGSARAARLLAEVETVSAATGRESIYDEAPLGPHAVELAEPRAPERRGVALPVVIAFGAATAVLGGAIAVLAMTLLHPSTSAGADATAHSAGAAATQAPTDAPSAAPSAIDVAPSRSASPSHAATASAPHASR